MRAAFVGGIPSNDLPFCAKSCFRAWLTHSKLLSAVIQQYHKSLQWLNKTLHGLWSGPQRTKCWCNVIVGFPCVLCSSFIFIFFLNNLFFNLNITLYNITYITYLMTVIDKNCFTLFITHKLLTMHRRLCVNLEPRVLRLLGQRWVAGENSGDTKKYDFFYWLSVKQSLGERRSYRKSSKKRYLLSLAMAYKRKSTETKGGR